jgi:hypothetical protein
MSILSKILEEYPDEGFGTLDGFEDALIGVWSEGRLVYSVDKVIEILQSVMNEEEAIAFYEDNIEGALFGPRAPICIKLIN